MDDFVGTIFGYLIAFAIAATIIFYLLVYVAAPTLLAILLAGSIAGCALSANNFIVALWHVYSNRIRTNKGVQA